MTFIQYAIAAICLAVPSAKIFGAVIITATEESNSVVFQGVGALNTSSLQLRSNSGIVLFSGLYGTPPVVEVGPPNSPAKTFIGDTLIGPNSIGALDSFKKSDRGEGDIFGITFLFPVSTAIPAIIVPRGYVSGTPLSGSAEYRAVSFATLGITPGIYTWKWGQPGSSDSLTVRIGIPEPETLVLVLVGAIPIFLARRHFHFKPFFARCK